MTDFYLARQAIHDSNQELLGYDLLFHSKELNKPLLPRDIADPAQILVSALLDMGLEDVVGKKLAFINLTKRYVLGELPIPLARKQIVLEIRQDILPGAELVSAFKQLKLKHSYTLALDAFDYDMSKSVLIPHVDYVKIDVHDLDQEQIQHQLELLGRFHRKRIAVGVNDSECFTICRDLGIEYFQGLFFTKPRAKDKDGFNEPKRAALKLIKTLYDDGLTTQKLNSAIAREVSLGSAVLKYINSSRFKLTAKVQTVAEAANLFGLTCVANWLAMLALYRINDKCHELFNVALIRARMCESLSKQHGLSSERGFLLGLLSVLDAIIDQPFKEFQSYLPFHGRLGADQSLAQVLKTVIAYESSEWEHPNLSDFPSGVLTDAYFEAIRWSASIQSDLLKNANSA